LGEPYPDDCYTNPLHNPAPETDLPIREGQENGRTAATQTVYTLIDAIWFGGAIASTTGGACQRFFERSSGSEKSGDRWGRTARRLPCDGPTLLPRRLSVISRRLLRAPATVDQRILSRPGQGASMPTNIDVPESISIKPFEPAEGASLRELYDAYMSDPTRDWSPRTAFPTKTTRRLAATLSSALTPACATLPLKSRAKRGLGAARFEDARGRS
jgi:hypothetical protein